VPPGARCAWVHTYTTCRAAFQGKPTSQQPNRWKRIKNMAFDPKPDARANESKVWRKKQTFFDV
jgi:hypothetical protein